MNSNKCKICSNQSVKINCHNAYEIEMLLMIQIISNNFNKIKFQKEKS